MLRILWLVPLTILVVIAVASPGYEEPDDLDVIVMFETESTPPGAMMSGRRTLTSATFFKTSRRAPRGLDQRGKRNAEILVEDRVVPWVRCWKGGLRWCVTR